jgi:hypothetical protein
MGKIEKYFDINVFIESKKMVNQSGYLELDDPVELCRLSLFKPKYFLYYLVRSKSTYTQVALGSSARSWNHPVIEPRTGWFYKWTSTVLETS